MKEEMERLNKLVDWYKAKLKEINEAPVDSRPRKLRKLYQYSEANKEHRVTITKFGTLAPVDYPAYPPALELPDLFIYYLFEILKTLTMLHTFTRKGAEVKCLNTTK